MRALLSSLADAQHDLPEVRARLHQAMRLGRRGERQDAGDRGAQPARGERGTEARPEALHDPGLLPDRAAAQRRADEREPADQKLRQVHLALGAAHEADHDEPPAGRERGQVLREIGGADVVEDDVDAAPAGWLAGPGAEVLATVVDGGRRAERHALPALLLAAGGGGAEAAGPAAHAE